MVINIKELIKKIYEKVKEFILGRMEGSGRESTEKANDMVKAYTLI